MIRSSFMLGTRGLLAAVAMSVLLAGCGGSGGSSGSGGGASDGGASTPSAKAALGKLIFSDSALSAGGSASCASCHGPTRAFTSAVPMLFGGPNRAALGVRNAPSLMYLAQTPTLQVRADGVVVGGFFLDGRAATLADQAQAPFLVSFEMGNRTSADVRDRLLARPYIDQFKALYGDQVLQDGDRTLASIGDALAAYQIEDPAFSPFSSKYDFVLRGQAALSAAEARGLAVFNDPSRGNCASCHPSSPSVSGAPLFTDFAYRNLGVPRNWRILYNNDARVGSGATPPPNDGTSVFPAGWLGAPMHAYFDLGLCGPGTPFQGDPGQCGKFKTPTLRNAAVKAAYFHNSAFLTLTQALRFLATRDGTPSAWYVQADGTTVDVVFNDLPLQMAGNVETRGRPFSAPGALADGDVADLLQFLCALTDGYDPANPVAYTLPPQCTSASQ